VGPGQPYGLAKEIGKEEARFHLLLIKSPVDLDPYRLLHFQVD
jgi:hypothetical protein